MKCPFIVLGGYQRTGKTTLGEALADRLGGVYTEAHGRNIDESDYIKRYEAFLEANIEISNQAREVCKTRPFIVNRHVFMTKAVHEYYLGLAHGALPFSGDALERLILPDAKIILTISKDELFKRFAMTNKRFNDYNSWDFQLITQNGVLKYIKEFNIPSIIIDTELHGIEPTLDIATKYVNQLSNC